MRRVEIWLVVLVVLMLVVAVVPQQTVQARAEKPVTITGTLHYSLRGPGAARSGIFSSFVVGGGSSFELLHMYRRILTVLALGEKLGLTGTKTATEALRKGLPIDFSQVPIVASFDATLNFTLEQKDRTTFVFKQGSGSWNFSQTAQFSVSDNGATHSFNDAFAGGGNVTLDPESTTITAIFDLDSRPEMMELNVDTTFLTPFSGTSSWRLDPGIMEIKLTETKEGTLIWDMTSLGSSGREEDPGSPQTSGVAYTLRGPAKDMLHRQETWQSMLNSQVTVEYALYPDCSATIDQVLPEEDWVIGQAPPFNGKAKASVIPPLFGYDLRWRFPELDEMKAKTTPQNGKGRNVDFQYPVSAFTTLPKSNSKFGKQKVAAGFEQYKGTCRDPESRDVRLFFPRDGRNNPEPELPNWFYYWKQTKAGQGFGDALQYDGNAGCDDYGYYNGNIVPANRNKFFVCNLETVNFKAWSYKDPDASKPAVWEGIDTFGVVVRHEGLHMTHWLTWWKDGYKLSQDRDGDNVPDALEKDMGLDPKNSDTHATGFNDEHYLVYEDEANWPTGSANSEDWACPGKQSKPGCEKGGK